MTVDRSHSKPGCTRAEPGFLRPQPRLLHHLIVGQVKGSHKVVWGWAKAGWGGPEPWPMYLQL